MDLVAVVHVPCRVAAGDLGREGREDCRGASAKHVRLCERAVRERRTFTPDGGEQGPGRS